MSNLLLLGICFVIGIALRQTQRFPDSTPSVLNGFIIHISLPALTLYYVHKLAVEPTLIFPTLMPWLLFALGFMFFLVLGRMRRWSPHTIGGLVLTGSLANTSFLGLPMIETFYGSDHLGIGILIDQLGTYLVLSTVGIVVAVSYSTGEASPRQIAKKILSFPPFLALVAAVFLLPFDYPPIVDDLLARLGSTLAPLALVSVGYQLRLGDLGDRLGPLFAGLLFQLLLGPALIMLLFVHVLGAQGVIIAITVFEAAMAPQIGASIVAMEHKLDPPLVTLMVGIGIPLSFLTLPVWWYVLQGV